MHEEMVFAADSRYAGEAFSRCHSFADPCERIYFCRGCSSIFQGLYGLVTVIVKA